MIARREPSTADPVGPEPPPRPPVPPDVAQRIRRLLRPRSHASPLRAAYDQRRIAYLHAISFDLTLKHKTDFDDPEVRRRVGRDELSLCDPDARRLSYVEEPQHRAIARLATGVFPWHVDGTSVSDWPEREREYWQAQVGPGSVVDTMNRQDDMADFGAAGTLRLLHLFGEIIPSFAASAYRDALLGMRFWLDEPRSPGGERMTFWSENHTITYAAAQYLVGQRYPRELFRHAGVLGRVHMERARPRILRWIERRLRWGFCEWMAPYYYQENFEGLLCLVDFADDLELRTRAAMAVDLLLFDLARLHCEGSFGVAAGRAYFEHKSCAWQQGVGDTVELLSGARGMFVEPQDAAIALSTSPRYDVPEVLLSIASTAGERESVERARVSINLDEARRYGIGFSSEDDVTWWWSLGGYFAPPVFEGTRRVAEAHDLEGPFEALHPPSAVLRALEGWIQYLPLPAEPALVGLGVALGYGGLLAPPLSWVLFLMSAASFAGALADLPFALTEFFGFVRSIGRSIGDLLGLADGEFDPDMFRRAWVALLKEYGPSPLSRANVYAWRRGGVMLSSVQDHCAGQIGAQKQSWQATLGMRASVWTTRPVARVGSGESWEEGFRHAAEDFDPMNVWRSAFDLVLPGLADMVWSSIGHDGPNYWTGSVTLPMVVQVRNALVAIYDPTPLQRMISGPVTHAWFPRDRFDEVVERGHWNFGRCGAEYVALWSASRPRWTHDGPWKDRELIADGWRSVWICQVGSAALHGTFEEFVDTVTRATVGVSGVAEAGSLAATASPLVAAAHGLVEGDLACWFDVCPRRGEAPSRLAVTYGGGATLDGKPVELDDFPRFDGPYARVEWEQHRYQIRHGDLTLTHDIDLAARAGSGLNRH